MKDKGTLYFISIALTTFGMAQTNTFPSSGNVGIGTTNPEAMLHVNAVSATGDIFIFEGEATSDGVILSLRALNGALPLFQLENLSQNATWNIENGRYGNGAFTIYKEGSGTKFIIDNQGDVGIGTIDPQGYKLAVNGGVRAKEVVVDTNWSDFVFEDSYRLRPLYEVESHIEEHGHLPDVPSAAVVVSEGLSVGEAQKIMMQKIEELTLYVIELKKENEAQQKEIERLKSN